MVDYTVGCNIYVVHCTVDCSVFIVNHARLIARLINAWFPAQIMILVV